VLPRVSAQWRREVLKRGRYWQWRRGSHKNREAHYGGTYDTLPNERKKEYEQNKTILQMRKARREMSAWSSRHATANGSGSFAAVGKRDCILPTGGHERRGGEWQ